MAIERLSIPEGYPIWGQTDPGKVADRLLAEQADRSVILSPGEYDVTPVIGPAQNTGTDRLIVFDDGTGLFRIIPKGQATTTLTLYNWGRHREQHGNSPSTGTQIHLPHDLKRTFTVTETRQGNNKGVPLMVEIIRWLAETDDIRSVL